MVPPQKQTQVQFSNFMMGSDVTIFVVYNGHSVRLGNPSALF